jgi:hypothetical protein
VFMITTDNPFRLLIKAVLAAISCVVMGAPAAQVAEPDYQFAFRVQDISPVNGMQTGTLQVSMLPPLLYPDDGDAPVTMEAVLNLNATLHAAQWLAQKDLESLTDGLEIFVLEKFRLFRRADQIEQFRQWLDPQTYLLLADSVSRNEVNLESDRQFYRQFDDIRLLGSIRYGVYTLLYTQFRSAGSGELMTSVMPARYVDNRLVTAGSLHLNSHALYRMLVFGTLQLQLVQFLEGRVKKL